MDFEEVIRRVRALGRQGASERAGLEELELLCAAYGSGGVVHRFLCLPPGGEDDLDPGLGLGTCWTDDHSAPYLEVLNVPGEADGGWRFFVISAEIAFDGIDLAETISRRLDLPWEKEIVLTDEAAVRIVAVRAWNVTANAFGREVRSDLKGVVATAGRQAEPLPTPAR